MSLDAEARAKIEDYKQLVLKWNRRLPLVSRKSPGKSLDRLIRNSLSSAAIIPEKIKRVIDVGSGAGLPGIPVAISRPGSSVTLVERSKNKTLFLRDVLSRLEIKNAEVACEHFTPLLLEGDRPLAVTAIGVGSYDQLAAKLWSSFHAGDGLLLFVNEALARKIAVDVSCGTFRWELLGKREKTGIAWLEK